MRRSRPRGQQDRPVLLDIGAVWCHWCHVMDGESYEDPAARRVPERSLRLHQGGPRRAARRGRALPARGAGAHPAGRLAAHGVPHAGGRGVLRRHLLPARRRARPARVPRRARERARGLPVASRTRCSRRRRRCAGWWATTSTRRRRARRRPRCSTTRSPDGAGVRSGERRVRRRAEIPPSRRDDAPAAPLVRPAGRLGAHHPRPHPARDGAAAGSTTSSAAASTATAWTPSGSCRTSRRCRTTTPSCSRRTRTPTPCSAPSSTRPPPAASSAGCGTSCRTRPAATRPARTPTWASTTTATTSPGPATRPLRS